MVRAELGTVLFKPTVCEGVTCKGLNRKKIKCKKKSMLLNAILTQTPPVHGLMLTKGV